MSLKRKNENKLVRSESTKLDNTNNVSIDTAKKRRSFKRGKSSNNIASSPGVPKGKLKLAPIVMRKVTATKITENDNSFQLKS